MTLQISRAPIYTVSIDTTVCANQLPYSWYGHVFTDSATIKDTVSSVTGCDVERTLHLSIAPLQQVTIDTTVCAHQLPYTWYGHEFTVSAVVKDTVSSATGCDVAR